MNTSWPPWQLAQRQQTHRCYVLDRLNLVHKQLLGIPYVGRPSTQQRLTPLFSDR